MSGLLWKINRLRVMTFSEILFRIWRACSTEIERYRLASGWQPAPKTAVASKTELFGDEPSLLQDWQKHFQLDEISLQQYLEGKIDFFGHESLSIGAPVDWHCEPVTGIKSPLDYGKELNYRDDKLVGNVKFLWELGRHQHLVPLAVAYAVSGQKRYLDSVVDQINGWINSNPYGLGIHWCSALEVSLRMVSWALVHSLLVLRGHEEGLFAFVDKDALGKSIYQHMYFVRHFLSLHSSANNHLIGEITGLWVGCSVFDLGREGQRWAEFAHNELEVQAKLQVFEDGVDKEQATYYHMWVLEYLLFSWALGQRTGKHFSSEFTIRLQAMLAFLKDMSPEGGEPPQIGDADDGFVARFDPSWAKHPYKEMIAAAESALAQPETGYNQKAFWYQALSTTAKQSLQETQPWQRNYPAIYRDGGYAILGDARTHLVMDAGSLGYLGIAAHGHADALSICLALDGEWWLVDPGTYAYHSEKKWRDYFRGTKSHNTVTVNNTDQSTIAGPFMWTQKASASLLNVQDKNGVQTAVGEHDGYKRFGVSHRRTVNFQAQEIELIDEVSGGENIKAEICFHFAPDIKVENEEKTGSWIVTRPNSNRRLIFVFDKAWEVKSVKGVEKPILGWYSPALEEKIASYCLRGEAKHPDFLSSMVKILLE